MISTDDILQQSMHEEDLIVCVKDDKAKVLQQNGACLKLCGNQLGKECHVGCMEVYENDDSQQWQDWGSRTYQNCHLHGEYFDVNIMSTSKRIITILQSLQHKYEEAFDYYKSFGLGKRERQVINLVIAGQTNHEIADQLFISIVTLRTHLKNIYNKVRDAGGELEYLPCGRG